MSDKNLNMDIVPSTDEELLGAGLFNISFMVTDGKRNTPNLENFKARFKFPNGTSFDFKINQTNFLGSDAIEFYLEKEDQFAIY